MIRGKSSDSAGSGSSNARVRPGSLVEVDGRLRALARSADLEARLIKARDELLEGAIV